jgi:hypothetical protein
MKAPTSLLDLDMHMNGQIDLEANFGVPSTYKVFDSQYGVIHDLPNYGFNAYDYDLEMNNSKDLYNFEW